jgi:hypothetical protein
MTTGKDDLNVITGYIFISLYYIPFKKYQKQLKHIGGSP